MSDQYPFCRPKERSPRGVATCVDHSGALLAEHLAPSLPVLKLHFTAGASGDDNEESGTFESVRVRAWSSSADSRQRPGRQPLNAEDRLSTCRRMFFPTGF